MMVLFPTIQFLFQSKSNDQQTQQRRKNPINGKNQMKDPINSEQPFCLMDTTIPGEPPMICFDFIQKPNVSFQLIQKGTHPIVNFGGPVSKLVPHSFLKSGFDTQFGRNTTKYNINYGSPRDIPFYDTLQAGQKHNQNPGSAAFTRKNDLATNIMAYQEFLTNKNISVSQEFDIIPKSYNLPDQLNELIEQLDGKRWYIYKPTMAARGESIKLFRNIEEIDSQTAAIVQEYLTDTLLYQERKFDLRVFFLVTSIDPFIVYIYNEGIARFASSKFQQPTKENANDLHIHLTNYAVNKNNNFKVKWKMTELLHIISKNPQSFINTSDSVINDTSNPEIIYKRLIQNVNDAVTKSLIASYPRMNFIAKQVDAIHKFPRRFFGYYGTDVILDVKGKAKLLEVNASPSLSVEVSEDEMKRYMLQELLNIIAIPANFDNNNQLIIPERKVPNQNVYEFSGTFTMKNQAYQRNSVFSMQEFNDYEKRVVQQISDEESRTIQFSRVLPDAFGLIPKKAGLHTTYLNDLCVDWLSNKNINSDTKQEL